MNQKVNTLSVSLLFIWYFVNDFFYIYFQNDFFSFIAADYLSRIISLALFLILGMRFNDFWRQTKNFGETAIWTILIVIFGFIANEIVESTFTNFFHLTPFFKFPRYPNRLWLMIDLSFGLLLVAISEEIIFRGVVISWLKKHIKNHYQLVLISSSFFASIHWGGGLKQVVHTFFWALLPSHYYIKTRRLLPCVVAHFITNFLMFSGYYDKLVQLLLRKT